jgi:hypothetical protein
MPAGDRRYVIVDGGAADGWAYGLAAAGLSADAEAPVLLVGDVLPPATMAAAGSCGSPRVDLVLVGDRSVISDAIEEELDRVDGGLC